VKRVAVWVGWVIWASLLMGIGVAWGWLGQSDLFRGLVNQTLRNTPPREVFQQDSVNILLLGCDETRDPRTKQILKKNARSDMMLVARLDFKNNLITALSIPRDLGVRIDGYGLSKINSYHDKGGPELSKHAVETVMGVPIDRVAVLDYDAFKRMVDLIGGVEVYVDKHLKYTDTWGDLYIDIKPGRQKLDGEQAMGFVRIRKLDSDFVRQSRQKDFLLAFKDGMLANPMRLPHVANEVQKALGGGLTNEEIASLALFARSVGPDNIKMGMIPVREQRGTTMLELDRGQLQAVLQDFKFRSAGYGMNQ